MAGGWYNTGFKAVEEERERQALSSASGADRFYVKVEGKAYVVFIDDEPFTIHEHTAYKDGDRIPLTCLQAINPDNPVCCNRIGQKSRYFCGYLTVLDCTEYPSRKTPGKVYQYELKLFPAKTTVLSMLGRKRNEMGSFAATKCDIFRDVGKTAAVGSEFTFKDKVADHDKMFSLAQYKGKALSAWFDAAEANEVEMKKLAHTFQIVKDPEGKLIRRIPPFNYNTLLAPLSPVEMTRVLAGNVTGSYEESQKSKASSAASGGGGGEPF